MYFNIRKNPFQNQFGSVTIRHDNQKSTKSNLSCMYLNAANEAKITVIVKQITAKRCVGVD